MFPLSVVRLTKKGQITIPAALRRRMGWATGCLFEVQTGEAEVTIHAVRTVDELSGIFHDCVRGRKPLSDEEETLAFERAVAEEAADD